MNDDFRYITAIAEYGSISQAARAMHISQPGLSQRLKRLEERLGANLFDRTLLPMKPTESGEVFIRYAKRALAAEDAMRREVYSAARNRRRRLKIGISMARANALLAETIVTFYETHKGCTLELYEMSSFDHMHKLFLNDGIDFAVLTPIMPDPEAYAVEVLCREQLMVAWSSTLRVPALEQAETKRVFLKQLEGVPFILPSCGQYFDPLISRLIDASHAQLDVVVRDCSAELALALVEDGLGFSIVPSTWVMGRSRLRSCEVADTNSGNVLRYIRRAGHTPSEEEVLFMQLLREWLDKK